jgi:hypothetical protein
MRTLGCDRRRLLLAGVGTAAMTAAALAMSSAPTHAAGVRAPVVNVRPAGHATLDNPIWAGYGVEGTPGSFTDVTASWAVPAVQCPDAATSYSAFWAGLDGDGSNTVEQIGTESDCIDGQPKYFAWYEMYPKKTVLIHLNKNLMPDDQITAGVSYVRKGAFTLTLDVNGAPLTITARNPSARLVSAEVIAEAPSSSHGPSSALPLADFANVSFSDATVNTRPLQSASPDEFVIQDTAGHTEASPNDTLSGETFSVTWSGSP